MTDVQVEFWRSTESREEVHFFLRRANGEEGAYLFGLNPTLFSWTDVAGLLDRALAVANVQLSRDSWDRIRETWKAGGAAVT